MKNKLAVLPALVLAMASLGQSQTPAVPTKVGIINMMMAIQQTKEGQKAIQTLSAKLSPKRDAIEKRQSEIQTKRDQLSRGSATLSADAKTKLSTDVDALTRVVNREIEDFQAEASDEEGKVTQELGAKMMEIVTKYGADNGFAVLLDVSSQQTPVIWAASGVDITAEIVKQYDAKYPAATSASPAAAPAPPAAKK